MSAIFLIVFKTSSKDNVPDAESRTRENNAKMKIIESILYKIAIKIVSVLSNSGLDVNCCYG